MDMNESEVVTDFFEQGGDGDTDEEGSGCDVDFLDRGGDGDTDEGGSGMDEGGSGSGESMEEDEEGRSARQHSGGRVASRYGVPSRVRSRSKGGVRGRGGRRGGGRRASRPTQDDRECASSGAPVDVAPFTQVVVPPSQCTRILLEFFSGFSLQSSLSLWLQRPIASPRTAPWSPQESHHQHLG